MRPNLPSNTLIALMATITVLVLAGSTRSEPKPPVVLASPAESRASETPGFPYIGATPARDARMKLALERFADAGLKLPPLLIVFRSSVTDCGGAHGRFNPSTTPWTITICSDEIDTVYEHELAHAWDRANLSDFQRQAFMKFRQLTVWSSGESAWNDRGLEWVAIVIQQGLSGLPLPPVLGDETISRLKAYEMLTGGIAPKLSGWLALREIPCAHRPTGLSLEVPDLSGHACGTALDRLGHPTPGKKLRCESPTNLWGGEKLEICPTCCAVGDPR